ncbi:MAG: alkyl hydroperoxide reductase subunit F [Muribaculaceae bacterium]|nr:alkyl hydroperoxide reductase subunit F [Muribaculaceae bacterium]
MLDLSIKNQVTSVFQLLEGSYTFEVNYNSTRNDANELIEFVNDVVSCSPRLNATFNVVNDNNILEFSLLKEGEPTGIKFRGIPSGHEFTSMLLAVLNADGKGKNLPDETIARRIKSIQEDVKLQSYVSLSCTNCPEVVQTLNIFALLNPHITHEMVDGAKFQEEVDALHIQAVPTVYANGKSFHTGRGDLATLLRKMEETFECNHNEEFEPTIREFDVVVVGGGPAGASSAIYSARKGLKVAIVAERIGGQVKETVGIENLISVPHTTGEHLAADLQKHINEYHIEVFEQRTVERANLQGVVKEVFALGGEVFKSKSLIIATGASWRKLNVLGEADYLGKGVAFCPHCDGPFYQGKDVAVIGGGNSGIEATIDLAGICRKVTIIEFADTLKADEVLQKKVQSLANVDIFTSMQTTEVIGNGSKMTALRVKDRINGNEREIALDGVFVQIGLAANSKPFAEQLETNKIGEIVIDERCRTSIPGVYAAGDVSTVPYKQIIIAMGEGAKAALTAFDDRIRK